jgi:outer membrane protein
MIFIGIIAIHSPMFMKTVFSICVMLFLFGAIPCHAQTGKSYLDSLLKCAAVNYPLIKAKRLRTQSLEYAVKYKQNDIIPSLSASYQLDYATDNNITGMVYPQYILPLSGPLSKANGNSYGGVPGTAAALDLLWEPITFGQRNAAIGLAKGNLQYAQRDETLTLFNQQVAVVNAWLNYLLLADLIKVYQSNVDRYAFSLKQAQTLVTSGLRPGTDSSSFNSQYNIAQMQLIGFERQRDSVRIALEELVGGKLPPGMAADSTVFKRLPEVAFSADTVSAGHPEVLLQKAEIDVNELSLKSMKKSIMPRLTLWSTGYGRGSGITADGSINSGDGWHFERYNYGFGAQIAFPVLDVFRLKPAWKQQELVTEASREQLQLTQLHLNSAVLMAQSALQKSTRSARLAPQQLQSATYSYNAIASRYESGLVNYYDVIQAQQLMFQAQATVKISNYTAWKALLRLSAYNGNLNLFLNQYGK